MRTTLIALAALTAFVATPAGAYEYKAGVSNCQPTLDKWIKTEADGGKKLTDTTSFGAFLIGTVTWRNTVSEELTIGPAGNQFCILARRFVAGPVTQ